MSLEQLLDRTGEYLAEQGQEIIRRAYGFAERAHDGQLRRSGEPFMEHPLQTALTLAGLQLDATAMAAALLHDVPEDCGVPLSRIETEFGSEVSRLVDGVTKLAHLEGRARRGAYKERQREISGAQAENLRKMLMAMAEDLRVVFIKLADRLHNMLTLKALPPQRRREIAQETMEIYAPLASRLGIWELKWQLEDLAFRYLQPEAYREMARLVKGKRASRERYVAKVVRLLKEELEREKIQAEVSGRTKHLYSIHTKRQRYAEQGKSFGDIYDLQAIRVLVNDIGDCYHALGVIHSLWHPIPGQFDDYIASAKDNLYQSLHTSVICLEGRPMEIQVRTHEMHRIAEYGVAAHWRYKEGGPVDLHYEGKIAWLRQLVDWQREVAGAEEFIESVKTDIFQDQVFVYTPKGDIKALPAGATPLDFAYRIHTDLGHRCVGAKVNGRLVALDYRLHNGDVVEIMATKTERGPSRDWLNTNLGYIATSHAREKIRQWFRRQERTENVEKGKEILERELRRLGMGRALDEVAALFKYERLEDFFAALGTGEVSVTQIAQRLAPEGEREELPQLRLPSQAPSLVRVMGVGDLLTQLGRCCNPVPGDEIVGYITRSKGITVHRRDCPNVANEEEKERLVPVGWGASDHLYPVAVHIEAWDRVGLLRDISTVVSAEGVNITAVTTASHSDRTASFHIVIEITGIGQLSRILSKIEGVRGVVSAMRSLDGAKTEGRRAS